MHALERSDGFELLGNQLGVGVGTGTILAPRARSGAPASSTAMCAHSVHSTKSAGWTMVASAITLAPVPFHTRNASVRGTEQVAEAGLGLGGPRVAAVGQRVAGVGGDDRLDHRRVGAGGVVAGEGPQRGGGHGWPRGGRSRRSRRPFCHGRRQAPKWVVITRPWRSAALGSQIADHERALQPAVGAVEARCERAAAVHGDVVVDDQQVAGFERDGGVAVAAAASPSACSASSASSSMPTIRSASNTMDGRCGSPASTAIGRAQHVAAAVQVALVDGGAEPRLEQHVDDARRGVGGRTSKIDDSVVWAAGSPRRHSSSR